MSIKSVLYIIIVPFIAWIISAIRIEQIFKKGRRAQIVAFYVVISLALSYLVVNFLYDFYEVSRIIS